MNAERTVTFAIAPSQEETNRVSVVEHEGFPGSWLAVAFDIRTDLEAGEYRLALTPLEARELRAALGAALADLDSADRRARAEVAR